MFAYIYIHTHINIYTYQFSNVLCTFCGHFDSTRFSRDCLFVARCSPYTPSDAMRGGQGPTAFGWQVRWSSAYHAFCFRTQQTEGRYIHHLCTKRCLLRILRIPVISQLSHVLVTFKLRARALRSGRKGTLTTTGHSTNFVMTLMLPMLAVEHDFVSIVAVCGFDLAISKRWQNSFKSQGSLW